MCSGSVILDNPLGTTLDLLAFPLKLHPGLKARPGPPSITVSALSRDTPAVEGFLFFPSWEVFAFVVAFAFRSSTKARFQNLAVDHSVPPAIYSVTELPTMIRCSDSPTARGGKALQSA